MATHSSFFAMIGVADQLGSLKTYLGQVLGVFSIVRLGRRVLNWLRGKGHAPPAGWANEWSAALNGHGASGRGSSAPGQGRPSVKPLLLFLMSAVGLPYLMNRLIKLLIAQQQAQQPQLVDGQPLDPSKLTFARAKWEFRGTEEWELQLARDEIVAIMEVRDNNGDGGWCRGRTRDGRQGWFPGNHVSIRTSPSSLI